MHTGVEGARGIGLNMVRHRAASCVHYALLPRYLPNDERDRDTLPHAQPCTGLFLALTCHVLSVLTADLLCTLRGAQLYC